MKITQKYLVVKYMAKSKRIGDWFCSHELVGKFVGTDCIGITPMERLYEILNHDEGIFSSEYFDYHLEHRAPRRNGNPTRFAQFRISKKTPRSLDRMGLKDFSFAV